MAYGDKWNGQQFGGGIAVMYPTPDSLHAKVEEYFDWCYEKKYDAKSGRQVVKVINPPTMAGLARYLGFANRSQLVNYKNNSNQLYEDIINEAKLRIEEYLETKLVNGRGNPAGVIFALKNNARWEEKNTTQLTGTSDTPMVFGWASNAADVIDVGKEEDKAIEAPVKNALEAGKVVDGG